MTISTPFLLLVGLYCLIFVLGVACGFGIGFSEGQLREMARRRREAGTPPLKGSLIRKCGRNDLSWIKTLPRPAPPAPLRPATGPNAPDRLVPRYAR